MTDVSNDLLRTTINAQMIRRDYTINSLAKMAEVPYASLYNFLNKGKCLTSRHLCAVMRQLDIEIATRNHGDKRSSKASP